MERANFGLSKIYVCASTGLSATIAYQNSPHDSEALFLYSVAVILLLLALLDAVVNDLLPKRFKAKRTLRWRYVIFIALAGTQLPWLYDALLDGRFNLGMLRYSLDVLVAAGVAVLDLKARYALAHAQHEPHPSAAALP